MVADYRSMPSDQLFTEFNKKFTDMAREDHVFMEFDKQTAYIVMDGLFAAMTHPATPPIMKKVWADVIHAMEPQVCTHPIIAEMVRRRWLDATASKPAPKKEGEGGG